MNFCCTFTTWNSSLWIDQVLPRALLLFDHIIILDTGSTDDTRRKLRDYAGNPRVEQHHFEKDPGRNAGRDANLLLQWAAPYRPKWIVKLDHDEYFEDCLHDELDTILNLPEGVGWIRTRRVVLWRDTNCYRIDGVYGRHHEKTMFRWQPGLMYPPIVHHLVRVPKPVLSKTYYSTSARLVHLCQTDEARSRQQVERLKTFDKDWTADSFPPVEKLRLRAWKENRRRADSGKEKFRQEYLANSKMSADLFDQYFTVVPCDCGHNTCRGWRVHAKGF